MKKNFFIIIIIFLTAFCLRLPNIIEKTVSADEHTAILWSTFPGILNILRNLILFDNHPPIFYLISKFSLSIMSIFYEKILFSMNSYANIFSVRMISVISSSLTAIIIYLIVKKFSSKENAIFSSIIFSVSAFNIYFSQEARMYSLLTLFILSSVYFYLKNNFKYNKTTILFLILAIYTHYLAIFFILAMIVSSLILKRNFNNIKNYFLIFAIPLISIIPWIIATKFGKNSFNERLTHFIKDTSIKTLYLTYKAFISGFNEFFKQNNAFLIFFILFLLINFFKNFRSKKQKFIFYIMIFTQIIFFTSSLITQILFKTGLYRVKYMIIIFPFFCIFFVLSLNPLNIIKRTIIIFFIMWNLCNVFLIHNSANTTFYDAVHYIKQKIKNNDILVCSNYAGLNYGNLFSNIKNCYDLPNYNKKGIYKLNMISEKEKNKYLKDKYNENKDKYENIIWDKVRNNERIWLLSFGFEKNEFNSTYICKEFLSKKLFENIELWFCSNEEMVRTRNVLLQRFDKTKNNAKFFHQYSFSFKNKIPSIFIAIILFLQNMIMGLMIFSLFEIKL